MLRLLPCLLAALALAVLATPAVASNDGLWGRKITICHVPPGKVALDEYGQVVWSKTKVVKIRTGKSAQNGHQLAEALGEHKAHKHDRIANEDGSCGEPKAEAEPEPQPDVLPE